nr:hypothetical protein [Tanacetum cinerariifolium]
TPTNIQVEDDDDDPEEEPSEEHEPEDDDEDPEEDPNEEHESKGSDETEPFKEDKIAVTPPPSRHHGARISVRPQTPMTASTQALIDAFASRSSPFPLPPISPAYDQAQLGRRAAMIHRKDDILEEDMPPRRRFALTGSPPGCDVAESSTAAATRAPRSQYDFVDTVEAGQGLIRSPDHDTQTITRAAGRAEDASYVRALQASERKMMTSIEEVNLRVSYQTQGIPLMNADEFLEMDPYEEEDPSEEPEPKDDDEDLEEDPNEEHEPEDEDTKEPFVSSDETEPFEDDETAVTPPPPRHLNEIRAEKIARVANPLALVSQQQVYHPQTHPTHYNQNSSTRSQQAATRNRGKASVDSPQPIYDQAPSMVNDDDETSKEKEIDKLIALISLSFKKIYKPTNNNLRTSSNTSRANQDNSPWIHSNAGYEHQRLGNVAGARETIGSLVVQKSGIQCYNCKEYRHVARECQKLKRAKDAAYHREKMLLCKQEEAGI